MSTTKPANAERRNLVVGGGVLLLVVVVCLTARGLSRMASEDPVMEGKRASQWFEAAVLAWRKDPSNTLSPPMEAFREMEGDAVPFLVRRLEERLGLLGRSYTTLYTWIPAPLAGRLPPPRDEVYRERRAVALEVLKRIGMTQRLNAELGEPSGKPCIALAIPAIRTALRDDPERAASALALIGPPSAPAVPDLIEVARGAIIHPNPGRRGFPATQAVQALGQIGPAASNAIPLLIEIATDPASPNRRMAVVALGGIGDPARQTVPVLASLLSDTDIEIRLAAMKSIAVIGLTPEEAVAPLEAVRRSDESHALWRTQSTLALWNREPDNEALRQDLLATLRSDLRILLLDWLRQLGPSASSLAPEIEPLLDDPDPSVERMARRALRAIGEPHR
jgi:HEAT repeat protein